MEGKIMDKKEEKLLYENGWVVECEDPLEILHEETGSFASGISVKIVLDSLVPKKDKTCYCGKPIDYTNSDCVTFGLCKEHSMDC